MDIQWMTVTGRRAFLDKYKEWLGDLVVCESGFLDYTEGLGLSDEETVETLVRRKLTNQPWEPARGWLEVRDVAQDVIDARCGAGVAHE